MKIRTSEARGDLTIINFGPQLRADPKAKFILYAIKYDPSDPDTAPVAEVYRQGPIPRKGRLRLRLKAGRPYMVMAQGVDVASMVHTAGRELRAPFHLTIDAAPSDRQLRIRQAAIEEQERRMRPNLISRAVKYLLKR